MKNVKFTTNAAAAAGAQRCAAADFYVWLCRHQAACSFYRKLRPVKQKTLCEGAHCPVDNGFASTGMKRRCTAAAEKFWVIFLETKMPKSRDEAGIVSENEYQ